MMNFMQYDTYKLYSHKPSKTELIDEIREDLMTQSIECDSSYISEKLYTMIAKSVRTEKQDTIFVLYYIYGNSIVQIHFITGESMTRIYKTINSVKNRLVKNFYNEIVK